MDLKKKMQSWHYQKRLLQKRENSKISVNGAAVKYAAKASLSRFAAKSTGTEIRKEIETINQRSRIESILPSTPNKNRGKK